MSPVAVSADRRFHRAHVKPARRKGIWWTLVIAVIKYGVVIAVCVYGGSRLGTFALESPLLQVAHIEAAGNHRVSEDEIRARLDGLRGENILLADLEQWRTALLTTPWLSDASFRRTLPSTIEVVVKERQPIAIGRMGGALYLVDERGKVIDEFRPQYAGLDLPIVDGFAARDDEARTNEARGALAARLIVALKEKPEIGQRLSQVDVSDVHNASVLLTDDPAELRLGEDRFLDRVETYLSLAATLRERVPDIDYVDLRFDGRIYVRAVGKSNGARSGGRSKVVR
jgi:cell division protein FtsQ